MLEHFCICDHKIKPIQYFHDFCTCSDEYVIVNSTHLIEFGLIWIYSVTNLRQWELTQENIHACNDTDYLLHTSNSPWQLVPTEFGPCPQCLSMESKNHRFSCHKSTQRQDDVQETAGFWLTWTSWVLGNLHFVR